MRVITLDGPTKTGKTCVGRHLAENPIPQVDGRVRFDSIGEFYRKMTVAVMDATGPAPEESEMMAQLQKVVDSDTAFDNERDWGDLHCPEVNALVSTVGCTALAQSTKTTWSEKATAAALEAETDLWIVDGRNPRRTMKRELQISGIGHALDLFIDCDVDVAARRSGTNIEELVRRRAQDVSGDDPLLVHPVLSVPFEPSAYVGSTGSPSLCSLATSTVASSWSGRDNLPTPIYLNTTELGVRDPDGGLARMLGVTSALVSTALEWYNDRDV